MAAHKEETIPAKAPTCTETGLSEGKKCSVCGEITKEQETTPAAGHNEIAIPGKAATCTAKGLTEGKKCSICGEITKAQEEIATLPHTYDDGVVSDSRKTYTCVKTGWCGMKEAGKGLFDGLKTYRHILNILSRLTICILTVH